MDVLRCENDDDDDDDLFCLQCFSFPVLSLCLVGFSMIR